MRSITRSVVAAVAAVLALSLVPAPDAAAQELARVYHVTPKDVGAFEAALSKHVKDRIEHDDPWSWGVYQVVVGKNLGDFYYRSGGHSWADFDEYDEGFGSEAGLHYEVNVAPLVKDTDLTITMEDTANSRYPSEEEWPDIELIEVVTYHLEPGMEQRFEQAVGAIHEAIMGSDWPARYAWANPVSGAEGPQKTLALFFEDWADMQEPETPFYEMLQEEMGEDETQEMMERLGNSFRSYESMVLRMRRDLSVPPPGMRGGDSMGGEGAGGGGGGDGQ